MGGQKWPTSLDTAFLLAMSRMPSELSDVLLPDTSEALPRLLEESLGCLQAGLRLELLLRRPIPPPSVVESGPPLVLLTLLLPLRPLLPITPAGDGKDMKSHTAAEINPSALRTIMTAEQTLSIFLLFEFLQLKDHLFK